MNHHPWDDMEERELIAKATHCDDLDEACRVIQDAVGQKDGGLAGQFFSGIPWLELGPEDRADLMREYLRLEEDAA
jgi:hypothetical protein